MNQSTLINELYVQIDQRIKKYYRLNIDIEFLVNLKGYRIIGQCKRLAKQKYIIRLHEKLLHEHQEIYLNDVLAHELAHAVQMELFPKSQPHSLEWKNIVSILLNLPYKKIKKVKYETLKYLDKRIKFNYKCSCTTHTLSAIRHNRIVKKTHKYHCAKCKAILSV